MSPRPSAVLRAGFFSNGEPLRDEEHVSGFITRNEDKLMYGSDCSDALGGVEYSGGAQMLAAFRGLSPNKQVERKLLFENAKRLLKLAH